jgi:hypothetical protein
VVADAVVREPVSGANSLLTGIFTGNFAISSQELEFGIAEIAVPQRYLTKFPTLLNRENNSWIREFHRTD